MAPRRTLRASDAERELVAERLRQATAEGRLLAEELEERLSRALRARTYGELDALVADLPSRRIATRPRRQMSTLTGAAMVAMATVVAVAMLAVAALLITGLMAGWALWVLAGWWFVGHRRRTCVRHHPQPGMRFVGRRGAL